MVGNAVTDGLLARRAACCGVEELHLEDLSCQPAGWLSAALGVLLGDTRDFTRLSLKASGLSQNFSSAQ